ncbi:heme-binding protein [Microbacterium sp. RU33B]|uniref:SOUL family heme-binding protein n=1 Tax=Microbacterium sp. RU33B TaxID=1907390 RepID=UPI00096970CF|nr:heme-binding protein [Microbacterium sp. RU33B]SIT68080.1 SOUL heme-binding protein [Microbacterium sp. RU33B]
MTEQQPYEVLRDYGSFETRQYPEHLVAQVRVEGPFESAGSRAFRHLFAYIAGANSTRSKIDMTAPVLQTYTDPPEAGAPAPRAIDAVTTTRGAEYTVSFVLPASLTADAAPAPADERVQVRTVPSSVVAAARYSGGWSESRYRERLEKLRDDVRAAGLVPTGVETSARFDPPFMPAFLRRNEVLLGLESDAGGGPVHVGA